MDFTKGDDKDYQALQALVAPVNVTVLGTCVFSVVCCVLSGQNEEFPFRSGARFDWQGLGFQIINDLAFCSARDCIALSAQQSFPTLLYLSFFSLADGLFTNNDLYPLPSLLLPQLLPSALHHPLNLSP